MKPVRESTPIFSMISILGASDCVLVGLPLGVGPFIAAALSFFVVLLSVEFGPLRLILIPVKFALAAAY